jgi:NTE family protein
VTSIIPSRLGLVLGGGGARGLAHIGVLEVLEARGLRPAIVAGSSMGGLIGALWAAGLSAREIADLARGFRFPRWFVPGAIVEWATIFRPAAKILEPLSFAALSTRLRVTAVDLERGVPVVLDHGPLLPAVRATCAVPGVMPPEKIEGHWLIDGGIVSMVPVDSVWRVDPAVVVAVSVSARRARAMPELGWKRTSLLSRFGRLFPNPATARMSFEILVRASEIALAHSTVLSNAMAGPELNIDVDVEDIGLRDFDRISDAVSRGRAAALRALPALDALLRAPAPLVAQDPADATLVLLDPVCRMTVGLARSRARVAYGGRTYLFCSENCRDAFLRSPEKYLAAARHGAEA